MRSGLIATLIAVAAIVLLPGAGEAKKFRYASGPKAPEDTLLTVSDPVLDPVIRPRGARVPYTNLQLIEFIADSAVAGALLAAPLDSGQRVVIAPALDHPLGFVAEHALLRALSRRRIEVTVRRSAVPDDSLAALFANPGDPLLEYSLASARVTYSRLVGFLPGRVKIERQGLVSGALVLRDPQTSRVLWSQDFGLSLYDRFSRAQVSLVEEERHPELKSPVPGRNVDKVFEPIVVIGVVAGLVALFFQNRP